MKFLEGQKVEQKEGCNKYFILRGYQENSNVHEIELAQREVARRQREMRRERRKLKKDKKRLESERDGMTQEKSTLESLRETQ